MSLSISTELESQIERLAHSKGRSVEQLLAGFVQQAIVPPYLNADVRRLLDISSALIGLADFKGRFLYVNPAFYSVLGCDEKTLLDKPFISFVHEDDVAATEKAYQTLMNGEPIAHFENRYFSERDGSYRWLSWTSAPNGQGLIYAIAQDITASKELEQKLQEKTLEVTHILESITDAFFALDEDFRFTFLNKEAERLLNRTTAELIGQSVWDEFPEAVGSEFYSQYEQVIREQRTVNFTAYYPPLEAWFDVKAYPARHGLSIYFHDVTAQKENQEILRQREEEFRALVEHNPDLVARFDRELRYIYVNPALEKVTGIEALDCVGKKNSDLAFSQNLSNLFEREIGNIFYTGQESRMQFDFATAEGNLTFESRLIPEFGSDGRVQAVLSIARDITDKKIAEEKLRASEERMKGIINSQVDLVCRYGADTTLTFVNDAYCRYFNTPREELIGRNFLSMTPLNQRGEVLERLLQVVADPSPDVRVFRVVHEDRQESWIQWVDYGIVDTNGNVVEIQAVGRDITELKEIEKILREQQEILRTIFDHIPVVIALFDENRNVQLVNRHWTEILGWTVDEMNAHPDILSTFYPEPTYRQMVLNYMCAAEAGWSDFKTIAKDGQEIDMAWANVRLSDGRSIGIGQIITARKQLEEQRLYTHQLEIEIKKERELMELKSRFISMVSHEYRTPLTIVATSTQLIRHYFARLPRERIFDKLDTIMTQVNMMTMMLENVLSFSKGSIVDVPLERTEVDIATFCHRVIGKAREIDDHHHQYQLELKLSSPTIWADEEFLERIVLNLLTNAMKYSPENTTITIVVSSNDNEYQFSIRDEGIGIPESDIKHLFKPFQRASNVGSIKGTGLGLAIVKQSVELHGGRIQVESRENAGTTFRFTLPAFRDT